MKYDIIIVKNILTGTPPVSASVPVSILHKNINIDFARTVYSSSINRCAPSFAPKCVYSGSYKIGINLI